MAEEGRAKSHGRASQLISTNLASDQNAALQYRAAKPPWYHMTVKIISHIFCSKSFLGSSCAGVDSDGDARVWWGEGMPLLWLHNVAPQ